eukprot:scaffold12915_cov21-Tisochrysis_lutea.AAC.2
MPHPRLCGLLFLHSRCLAGPMKLCIVVPITNLKGSFIECVTAADDLLAWLGLATQPAPEPAPAGKGVAPATSSRNANTPGSLPRTQPQHPPQTLSACTGSREPLSALTNASDRGCLLAADVACMPGEQKACPHSQGGCQQRRGLQQQQQQLQGRENDAASLLQGYASFSMQGRKSGGAARQAAGTT